MEIDEEMITELVFFIDTHPTFDGKIVDGILNSIEQEQLTSKQYEALKNIYTNWNVHQYCINKNFKINN